MCIWNSLAWKNTSPPELRPVIYKRYVDGTFLLYKNTNQIEKLKYYLNLQHTNFKFISLSLKLRRINHYLFLTSKMLEKTTNSLALFIASLNSVACLLTLRVLYIIRTNMPYFLHCHIELSKYVLSLRYFIKKLKI